MANVLYDKGREGFLGSIDWGVDDIRCILVDLADYTFSQLHDNLDDVPVAARVAVSASLASKTITDGVANAAGFSFGNVTGDPSEALILYKHTGVESTSRLICFIDTATNLPITPNGGPIDVAWDTGANKIFKL